MFLIDNELHEGGNVLKHIYSTDVVQIGQSVTIEAKSGKALLINVPIAGFLIFELGAEKLKWN